MKRRNFISTLATASGLVVSSGCSSNDPPQTRTNTPVNNSEYDEDTTSDGETPSFSEPMMLEINNLSPESVSIRVQLLCDGKANSTDHQKKEIYSEEMLLSPNEKLDLKHHRKDETMDLIIENDTDILFERQVEPHEGYDIKMESNSEVEVDWVIR